MAVSLKHAFTSGKGDGPDASVVRPSNWNAEHNLTLVGPAVLGKPTAGGGAAVEVPVGAYGLQLLGCADAAAFNAITGSMPPGAVMAFISGGSPLPGWVFGNGTTIGDAASAGTQRKNADCWPLFNQLYNALTDIYAPVTPGGRSGNALNDFNAHKAIRLPDLRGRSLVGDDVNGSGTPANVRPGAGPGNFGGSVTKTIAQANLPAVAIPVTGSTDPSGSHSHPYDRTSRTSRTVASGSGGSVFEADAPTPNNTTAAGVHIHPVSGNTANLGSGTALNVEDPWYCVAFFIKL